MFPKKHNLKRGRDVTPDEAEWYMDISAKVEKGVADAWGVTFGQFDEDEAMEVAVGTKEGWVAIFDGETEEMQWKIDMDNNDGADSLCYSLSWRYAPVVKAISKAKKRGIVKLL